MTAEIHIYTRPGCGACGAWRTWLQAEGLDYEEYPLGDIPAHRCGKLLEEIARGDAREPAEHGPFAPVVWRERPDGHLVLIAHGTEPLFSLPKKRGGA